MVEKSGNIWKTFLEPINTKAEKEIENSLENRWTIRLKYIYIYILIYVLDFGDLEEKNLSLFFNLIFFPIKNCSKFWSQ